jgi:hypothetical protein
MTDPRAQTAVGDCSSDVGVWPEHTTNRQASIELHPVDERIGQTMSLPLTHGAVKKNDVLPLAVFILDKLSCTSSPFSKMPVLAKIYQISISGFAQLHYTRNGNNTEFQTGKLVHFLPFKSDIFCWNYLYQFHNFNCDIVMCK